MLSRGELRSRPVPVFNPGTRHRRDPSPPLSCSIASFRLWPLAIIPQRRDVRRQVSGVKRRDSAHTVNAVTTTHCRASRKTESHCRSPAHPKPLTIGNGDTYHASALHPTLASSSDGPPALVAHSPVGGLLSRFRPGETQSRRGTHSSDSVHSANPEESGAGVTHPRTPPTRCAFR